MDIREKLAQAIPSASVAPVVGVWMETTTIQKAIDEIDRLRAIKPAPTPETVRARLVSTSVQVYTTTSAMGAFGSSGHYYISEGGAETITQTLLPLLSPSPLKSGNYYIRENYNSPWKAANWDGSVWRMVGGCMFNTPKIIGKPLPDPE